jgi:hypothetical protein
MLLISSKYYFVVFAECLGNIKPNAELQKLPPLFPNSLVVQRTKAAGAAGSQSATHVLLDAHPILKEEVTENCSPK